MDKRKILNLEYVSSREYHYPLRGYFLKIGDANFHNYSYEVTALQLELGDLFQGFKKKALTIPIQLIFYGSRTRRETAITNLFEDFSRDRETKTPGKIVFNGWELQGFVIAEKIEPEKGNDATVDNTTFYAPIPYWEKEARVHFYKNINLSSTTQKGDYPFEYEDLDYLRDQKGLSRFQNESKRSVDFLLRIYGPINYPEVEINRRKIAVRTLLQAGEYLEIDSRQRTVITTRLRGQKVNQFHLRDLEHDIFHPIDPGSNDVTWSGDFEMDLYLKYRRDYPTWEDL